jgi:hypothetical protein
MDGALAPDVVEKCQILKPKLQTKSENQISKFE